MGSDILSPIHLFRTAEGGSEEDPGEISAQRKTQNGSASPAGRKHHKESAGQFSYAGHCQQFGFGNGMCCTILWSNVLFIPGIIIGLIGIAGVALAYPLNNHLTKKERERLAPEILKLTTELMNGQA